MVSEADRCVARDCCGMPHSFRIADPETSLFPEAALCADTASPLALQPSITDSEHRLVCTLKSLLSISDRARFCDAECGARLGQQQEKILSWRSAFRATAHTTSYTTYWDCTSRSMRSARPHHGKAPGRCEHGRHGKPVIPRESNGTFAPPLKGKVVPFVERGATSVMRSHIAGSYGHACTHSLGP